MRYKTLGDTGLQVSTLCFGTMTFGDGRGMFKVIGAVGQEGADELVKASIEGGINFFDTADVYAAIDCAEVAEYAVSRKRSKGSSRKLRRGPHQQQVGQVVIVQSANHVFGGR